MISFVRTCLAHIRSSIVITWRCIQADRAWRQLGDVRAAIHRLEHLPSITENRVELAWLRRKEKRLSKIYHASWNRPVEPVEYYERIQ